MLHFRYCCIKYSVRFIYIKQTHIQWELSREQGSYWWFLKHFSAHWNNIEMKEGCLEGLCSRCALQGQLTHEVRGGRLPWAADGCRWKAVPVDHLLSNPSPKSAPLPRKTCPIWKWDDTSPSFLILALLYYSVSKHNSRLMTEEEKRKEK